MVLQNVHVIKQKQMLRLIHTHLQTHTVVKIFSGSLSQLMHSSGQGWSDRLGVIDRQFVYLCDVLVCGYMYLPVCVSLSSCVYTRICGEQAKSDAGHQCQRPPHDLSYFYREVSLASPQTSPVQGESNGPGWSAVTEPFELIRYFLEHAFCYISKGIMSCNDTCTSTSVEEKHCLHK